MFCYGMSLEYVLQMLVFKDIHINQNKIQILPIALEQPGKQAAEFSILNPSTKKQG